LLDRYALFDKIGAGGMATVHLGRVAGAAGFSRTVAIKRLHPHLADDPSFVSMFVDEARLAARIHHPNVVQTLDVVATGDQLLIVMEYVEGASLSRLWTATEQKVDLPIASAIVCDLLHGLHAAHEARDASGERLGLVHRDVSPQNVMVGVDGTARVLDFGVAKAVGRLQTTREGVVKGKLGYMAPEQARGGSVTSAADVYAAGVILWELAACRPMFTSKGDAELLLDLLAGAVPPPSRHAPRLPRALDTLIMRGLAARPADRFPSARAMADALARAVPPAQPHDVAAWVERHLGEELTLRRARIAELESDVSARGAPLRRSHPSLPSPGAPPSRVPEDTRSSISLAPRRHSRRRRGPSRYALLGAASLGAAIAVVGTLLLLGRHGGSWPVAPVVSAAAGQASAVPRPVPQAVPTTVPEPLAALTASAAPGVADAPSAPSASIVAPVAAPTPRPRPGARTPRNPGSLPKTLPLSPD
jgi:serine/threonine-protein kinase